MLDLIGKQLKKLGLIAKNTNSVETLKVKKTFLYVRSELFETKWNKYLFYEITS